MSNPEFKFDLAIVNFLRNNCLDRLKFTLSLNSGTYFKFLSKNARVFFQASAVGSGA